MRTIMMLAALVAVLLGAVACTSAGGHDDRHHQKFGHGGPDHSGRN